MPISFAFKSTSSSFSPQVSHIKKDLQDCLNDGAEPIAAFDADGTLWPGDVGFHLLKYQIENKLLPDLPSDFQEFLERRKKKPLSETLLWMAQVNRGVPLITLREWVRESSKSLINLSNVFKEIRDLVHFLLENQVEVYIVSASFKWALEPLAELFSVPLEKALGVTTKIKEGILTEVLDGCITWNQGKVEALLKITGGKRPFFSASNSLHDLPLLELASHRKLVVVSAPRGQVNYSSEQGLLKIAKEKKWYSCSYVAPS